MRVTDPFDSSKSFKSVQELAANYVKSLGIDLLARVIDTIGARPDVANPAKVLSVTGTGANQTIAHGMKDDDGKNIKPRTWAITKFKACSTIEIVNVTDTEITVNVTDKGECSIALFA